MKKLFSLFLLVFFLGLGLAEAKLPSKQGKQVPKKIQSISKILKKSRASLPFAPNCFAMEPNLDSRGIGSGLGVGVQIYQVIHFNSGSVSNAFDVPYSEYNEATPGIFKILYYSDDGDAPTVSFRVGFAGTSVSDSAASDDAQVGEFCPDLQIRQRPYNTVAVDGSFDSTIGSVQYYSTNPREPYWIASGNGRCFYEFDLDLDAIDLTSPGRENLGVEVCSTFESQVTKGRFLIQLEISPGDEIDQRHSEVHVIAPWKRGDPTNTWGEWVDRLFE